MHLHPRQRTFVPGWAMPLCLLALTGLYGCGSGSSGPERHALSGAVTLDGAPVQQGTISFVPAGTTSGPSGGASIVDGSYSVPADKGLVAGKYRVEIRAPQKTGKQIEVGSPSPPGTLMDETVESVPARYNTSSALEAEVPAPDNTLDFKLTRQ